MFPPKGSAGFVLRVLVFYGLLVLPWPGLREAYSGLFRGGANVIFGPLGSEVRIWFGPPLDDFGPDKDVELALQRKGSNTVRATPINTRLTGYLPTASVIALILATPIRWSRRWKALLWGILWVNAFIALRLAITLLYALTSQPPYIEGVTPFWSNVAYRIYEVAVRAPPTSFVVPVLIWILVVFRRRDSQIGRAGYIEGETPCTSRRLA